MQELVFKPIEKITLTNPKQAMETALQEDPNSLMLLVKLLMLELEEANFPAARAYAAKLLKQEGNDKDIVFIIARLYSQVGRMEDSLAYLDLLTEADKQEEEILYLKAKGLNYLGKVTEAEYILQTLKREDKATEDVLLEIADLQYKKRAFQECLELSKEVTATHPQHVIANKMIHNSLYNANTNSRTNILFDYKNLAKIYQLGNETADFITFNNELTAVLNAKKEWIKDPVQYTTTKGEQLNSVLEYSDAEIQTINQLFQEKVLEYVQQMAKRDPAYFKSKSTTLDMKIWAVRLHSAGYQKPHIHATGWISGVYYTSLPQLDASVNEGGLAFGVYSANDEFVTLHQIQPQVGMLVLFPSYLLHRTIPFTSDQQRVCLSFDVFPAQW